LKGGGKYEKGCLIRRRMDGIGGRSGDIFEMEFLVFERRYQSDYPRVSTKWNLIGAGSKKHER
jgi:hypothetical protein